MYADTPRPPCGAAVLPDCAGGEAAQHEVLAQWPVFAYVHARRQVRAQVGEIGRGLGAICRWDVVVAAERGKQRVAEHHTLGDHIAGGRVALHDLHLHIVG